METVNLLEMSWECKFQPCVELHSYICRIVILCFLFTSTVRYKHETTTHTKNETNTICIDNLMKANLLHMEMYVQTIKYSI